MRLLTAPWVVTFAGPPLTDGAVLIDGSVIVRVGPAADLLAQLPPGTPVERLEDAALTPAFVNAHTHLELTDLPFSPREDDYVGWLRGVIAAKRAAGENAFREAAALGARRCLALGQTVVADVASRPEVPPAYPARGPLILCQPEVICPGGDPGPAIAAALEFRPAPPARWGGLFAHAPYTVSAAAYRACRDETLRRGGRFFTHVAESADETRFCLTGDGPLPERLYAGVSVSPPAPKGRHPVTWLDDEGLLAEGTVLVHAVHLLPEHPALLARRGVGSVLCPRSNRALGVGDAPGRALLDAGVTVGLGTDSSLSAGSLDLLEDARAAVDAYGWSPAEALAAATRGSARLLGLAASHGAIAPGLNADILAFAVPAGAKDLLGELLARSERAALWRGGERIF